MSEQIHEGPWRKINEFVADERQLNERHIGPTYSERLNERYGQGSWRFETAAYEQRNAQERLGAEITSRLASEGLANALAGRGYRLDDGTDIAGKVTRYARQPDWGGIVISPDAAELAPKAPGRVD